MQPDTELQAKQDVSQVHDEGCWLRDEEAASRSTSVAAQPQTLEQYSARRGVPRRGAPLKP
jgi:hypothetical protein